jgi:hypothetical protein
LPWMATLTKFSLTYGSKKISYLLGGDIVG